MARRSITRCSISPDPSAVIDEAGSRILRLARGGSLRAAHYSLSTETHLRMQYLLPISRIGTTAKEGAMPTKLLHALLGVAS